MKLFSALLHEEQEKEVRDERSWDNQTEYRVGHLPKSDRFRPTSEKERQHSEPFTSTHTLTARYGGVFHITVLTDARPEEILQYELIKTMDVAAGCRDVYSVMAVLTRGTDTVESGLVYDIAQNEDDGISMIRTLSANSILPSLLAQTVSAMLP